MLIKRLPFCGVLMALHVLAFAQIGHVDQTANNLILPYEEAFRPGANLGYFPPWSDVELSNIAAGNEALQLKGVGVKTIRPALYESFLEEYGYGLRLPTFEHYEEVGLTENTLIIGFPSPAHRDPNFYCPGVQSETFANLYAPIWDDGQNGTPVNDENYLALYLYKLIQTYGDHVRFWEIWNEPGFDYTGAKGWLPSGQPGNWWQSNPEPCDYKLRAPISHFVRTLRVSYEVIKRLAPDDYIVLSGVGYPSFLDAVLRNTDNPVDGSPTEAYPLGGGAYFDVMGFHSYPHFDGSLREWSNEIGGFRYYRHSDAAAAGIKRSKNIYQDVLKNYGYDGDRYPQKLWIITECNLPRRQFNDFIGSDEAQRNFLMKAYLECIRQNILQLHIYSLAEQKGYEEASTSFDVMGLYQKLSERAPYNQLLNQSGIAYKTTSDLLFGKKYDSQRTAALRLPANIDGAAFVDEKGIHTYMLWAKTENDLSEEATATYSFPTDLGIKNFSLREWDYSESNVSTPIDGQNIKLTSTPIFLTELLFFAKINSCAPTEAVFSTVPIIGAANWQWIFEGGSVDTVTMSSPTVYYSDGGKFEVTLRVFNNLGQLLAEQQDYIIIDKLPSADFSVYSSGPMLTLRNSSSSNVENFTWNLGDGTISNAENLQHIYQRSGNFLVRLTVSNRCGSNTMDTTLTIATPGGLTIPFTANTTVRAYDGLFRPGSNFGYYPPWTDEQIAAVAAGDRTLGIDGIGVKTMRPALTGSFAEEWGYDHREELYDYMAELGLDENTLIVGFPAEYHRDPNYYCPTARSEHFANLYTDIWDDGTDGTPINDSNYYAAYIYKLVTQYGDHVRFWEIWNEPGFDYTGAKGWLPPGQPGNWWENNPDPCEYKLRAPIFHYVRLLRVSYEVIKTLDPDAYVVLSGVGYNSFLDALLRNTDNPIDGSPTMAYPYGAGAYFDVMGFHSYPHFDGSTKYYDIQAGGFAYKRHSDAAADGIMRVRNGMQEVLEKYGYDGIRFPKKLWIITECNIPRRQFGDYIGGEEVQRNFTMKAIANCMINDFLQLHIFSLAERQKLENASFEFDLMGLYKKMQGETPFTQQKNEAGIAFATTSQLLYGTKFDPAHTQQMALPTGVRGGAFKDSVGKYVYMLWAETTVDQSEQVQKTYSFPTSFALNTVYRHNWDFSETGQRTPISSNTISLGSTPIFLRADTDRTFAEPIAAVEVDTTIGCSPFVVHFRDKSINATSWKWTFPGGTPATSTEQNPVVTYTTVGTFDVFLEVSNSVGTHRIALNNYLEVKPVPVADFTYEQDGLSVTFNVLSENRLFTNFFWDFGTGIHYPSNNPTYEYQRNGIYEVTMVPVSHCVGDTVSTTIKIAAPPKVDFKIVPEISCNRVALSCVDLSKNITSGHQWYFLGGTPSSSTNPREVAVYRRSGTYPIMLIVSNEIATDTLVKTIDIQVDRVRYIEDTLCAGGEIIVKGRRYNEARPTGIEYVQMPDGCDSIIFVNLHFAETENPIQLVSRNIRADDGTGIGRIAPVFSGGNPPYTYHWNTGATTSAIDSLYEGAYAVSITDGSSCIHAFAFYVPTVRQEFRLGDYSNGQLLDKNKLDVAIAPNPIAAGKPTQATFLTEQSQVVQVNWYTSTGILVHTAKLEVTKGTSTQLLDTPTEAGLYILHFIFASGERRVQRILII